MIGGANTSTQDFSNHVGIGSSRQEALEDSRTILDTSSIDSAEKLSRFSLGVTGMSPRFFFYDFNFFEEEGAKFVC